MISFDEAFARVGAEVRLMPVESIAVDEYPNRVLAEDVKSPVDLPLFDNSAVDGYAIHASDLQSTHLQLIGESRAGVAPEFELKSGVCARIFTGAPLPLGTGAVVMQEDVTRSGDSIRLEEPVKAGAHIRRQGEELRSGETILDRGTLLTPGAVGAICSAGIVEVSAYRKPIVGLLVSGDELQWLGKKLKPGQIYDSNSEMIRAAVMALGLEEPDSTAEKDNPKKLRRAIESRLDLPVLITSGGVSVGDHDHLRPVLADLGVEEVFWKVAIKPGKPFFFGRHANGVVFGLPGNPVSALVCYSLFVRPYLRAIQGLPFELDTVTATVTLGVSKLAGREEFVPGILKGDMLEPMIGRASHKPSCMAHANALLRVPAEATEVARGDRLQAIRLEWGI